MAMEAFYWTMDRAFRAVYGKQQMLHYPLFVHAGQSLIEGQQSFSDHVVEQLGGIDGHDVLEIGCGNGEQANYLATRHQPASYRAIDLYPPHIAHAQSAAGQTGSRVSFAVDDAQRLSTVADASANAALCVESAHHYPDKPAFLANLHRVLRPGGRFAIAELVSISGSNNLLYRLTDTFCWTEPQWRDAITAAGLTLDAVDDVTERLALGLRSINGVLPGGGGPFAWLARFAGRGLIRHYRAELAGDRRYLVLSGRRPANAA